MDIGAIVIFYVFVVVLFLAGFAFIYVFKDEKGEPIGVRMGAATVTFSILLGGAGFVVILYPEILLIAIIAVLVIAVIGGIAAGGM